MSNNDLTHVVEGSSQPNTDRNSNMNPNPETSRGHASGYVQEKRGAAPSGQPEPTLSEARLRANRENAKKSTGPKTFRGKAWSRFNALKHGLLSKKTMFAPDGKLQDESLLELLESLRDKYGRGDVRTELLVEGIVIEYWRNGQALEIEQACIQYAASQFTPQGVHGKRSTLPYRQRSCVAEESGVVGRADLANLGVGAGRRRRQRSCLATRDPASATAVPATIRKYKSYMLQYLH
jgi:hypothetical protein